MSDEDLRQAAVRMAVSVRRGRPLRVGVPRLRLGVRVPVAAVRVRCGVHVRVPGSCESGVCDGERVDSCDAMACDAGAGDVRRLTRRRSAPSSLDQVELRRRHSRPQHPLGGELVLADAEAPERAAEVLEREPRVEQRAEDHVARGAIETVEIQQLHAWKCPVTDGRP